MGFMARLRGEEPGYLRKLYVQWTEGTGGLGEYLTEYALEHGGLGETAAVYRNLLVPRATGPTGTSEVDVLLLHERGLFVLESKNYDGWIFGSEGQAQWTQSLPGGRKERFYSPVLQNRAHVRALAARLALPESAFRSYIVFSERCELKKVPDDTPEFAICHRQNLLKVLRRDLESRDAIFGAEELARLRAELDALAQASTAEAREAHVEEAKRVKAGEVCPRCGGELVRRSGRYGEFMGCANYPRCKYTRKL